MARNKELIEKRDKALKERLNALHKLYPHWKHSAIMNKLSNEFYISERSISKVLYGV